MKKNHFFSLLKNKDYLLLIFGLLISNIGTFMQTVAVNWQLYVLTKSALSLGLVGLAKFLPILILSFFSGIIADIFDRKKILFIVQVAAMLNALALAFFTITGKISPLLIYIFVGLEAGLYTFDAPARQSLTPNIVKKEELPMAFNINNIFFNITNFIGPAAAGFIIAFYGVKTVYILNAISFFSVFIALFLMKPIKREDKKPKFNIKAIREGLSFVFKTPIIFSSMMIDFFATFFASAMTLMPIFAVNILKTGPREMGFLYAAPSIGALFGGFVFPFLSKIKNKGKLLISAVITYGFAVFFFAISRNFFLSLVMLAISGIGDMISVVIRNTIRHLKTPNYLRGRMVAINMVFYSGGPQLGEIEAGFAATLLGAPISVALGGLATIFTTIYIALKNPQLINYKEIE